MKRINKILSTIIGVSVMAAVVTGCNAETVELSKTSIDSFNSVKLDVEVAEIDIIPSADEFAIEYSITGQNVDYSVEDDVLTVNTKAIGHGSTFNTKRSYIKIYVPEGSEFVSLDYDGDVGDINIKDISFEEVDISTDVGNVDLTNITVIDSISVKTAVGNVKVDLANSDCSYEVSADIADININGSSYDGMDVKKSYDSDEGPEVIIKTDCGRINLEY